MMTMTHARIICSQRIYGLYGLDPHTVQINGDVADAGRTDERTREDATQSMDIGDRVS